MIPLGIRAKCPQTDPAWIEHLCLDAIVLVVMTPRG
jgi:hypothetical protein